MDTANQSSHLPRFIGSDSERVLWINTRSIKSKSTAHNTLGGTTKTQSYGSGPTAGPTKKRFCKLQLPNTTIYKPLPTSGSNDTEAVKEPEKTKNTEGI